MGKSESTTVPSVEVTTMLGIGRGVLSAVTAPVERRLRALPAEEFDTTTMERARRTFADLEAAAEAYARLASAESDVQVPLDVAEAASELKARIYSYLDFELGARPDVAAELAAIRSGHGHADLASDLSALAGLVAEHDAVVRRSSRFEATDAARARELAAAITAARLAGQKPATRKAGEKYGVAFAAYAPLHKELVDTLRWLLRKQPADARAGLRSLFSRAPSRPRAKKKKAKPTS